MDYFQLHVFFHFFFFSAVHFELIHVTKPIKTHAGLCEKERERKNCRVCSKLSLASTGFAVGFSLPPSTKLALWLSKNSQKLESAYFRVRHPARRRHFTIFTHRADQWSSNTRAEECFIRPVSEAAHTTNVEKKVFDEVKYTKKKVFMHHVMYSETLRMKEPARSRKYSSISSSFSVVRKKKARDDALSVNYHPVSFAGIIIRGSSSRQPHENKKPVVNDQISAIEHTPVNTLKACDGTKSFIISTTQFFSFFSLVFALWPTTLTLIDFSPPSAYTLFWHSGLEFHQLPGHFPQPTSLRLLTWICTQLLIFVCIGCLSAACVLKMSTHSFSGARHRRQQALPEFCVIVDPFNVFFFFFTELSCRRLKKLLVISLESHTVFSGNAADSELACILSVSWNFFFFRAMGFLRETKKRESGKNKERTENARGCERELRSGRKLMRIIRDSKRNWWFNLMFWYFWRFQDYLKINCRFFEL